MGTKGCFSIRFCAACHKVATMTKTEIGQALKKARLRTGLTQKQAAEKLGRKQQTLASWEIGQAQPDANTLFTLCAVYGTSVDETFGFAAAKKASDPENPETQAQIIPFTQAVDRKARGHMEKYLALDSFGRKVVDTVTDVEFDRITHQNELGQKIETEDMILFDMPVSAGDGALLGDEGSYRHMPVVSNTYTRRADFMLRVKGHSMQPRYFDGDYILVQEQPDVDFGDIGVWVVNGYGYVKQKDDDYLRSLNPKYPDIHFSEWDDYRCRGKVIGTLDPQWIVE